MKYVLILTLIVCCFIPADSYSQLLDKESINQDKDTIVLWSKKRKLTWDDFKGIKKDTIFNSFAESHTEIRMIPYLSKHNTYSYKVLAFFYKDKSFTNSTSDYLLSHEQLHFDITELFARKIRQEIQVQESKSFYVNYSSIFNNKYKSCHLYQNLYDSETNHSTNFEMQEKWKNDILHQLEELKNYEF